MHLLLAVLSRYKCPFLRGHVDPIIEKHSKIEKLTAKDLGNWLSNLYFEVIKLPRLAIIKKDPLISTAAIMQIFFWNA